MYLSKVTGLLMLRNYVFNTSYRYANKSSAEYCLENVKKHDYENFICAILLQNTFRSCALAVRSFNVEVSRVAEQVSQENLGLMRFKFWEDVIEKCFSRDFKDVPKHPVAIELFKANSRVKLSKRYLMSLISSRKKYFMISDFKNLEDMENYMEQSVSSVFYLILEGCSIKNINADHAASHIGKAQGIIQQIRNIPHMQQLKFVSIPQDILIRNKVSEEEILRAKSSEYLNNCVYEMATRANQHLVKARSLMDKIPKQGRSALLPAVPVFIYLNRLQNVNYNVFHPSLQYKSWKLLPQLWLTNMRNKF